MHGCGGFVWYSQYWISYSVNNICVGTVGVVQKAINGQSERARVSMVRNVNSKQILFLVCDLLIFQIN